MSGDGGQMWANLQALAASVPRLEADLSVRNQQLGEMKGILESLIRSINQYKKKGYELPVGLMCSADLAEEALRCMLGIPLQEVD